MNPSLPLYEWFRWWEGRGGKPALEAYKDGGGVWTIGYGRIENVKEFDTCTREQAERWMYDTCTSVGSSIQTVISVPMRQCEFDAMLAFVYNIGFHAFVHGGAGGTQSQVLLMLNSNRFKRAMDLHAEWCHDNGVISAGLVHRRASERLMFETANYLVYP